MTSWVSGGVIYAIVAGAEPASIATIVFLLMIVGGVVGLELAH